MPSSFITSIRSPDTDGHDARLLGDRDLARVHRAAVLHAGADQRSLVADQRHGLALHVRAHQGTRRVVVLEERDQRRGDRHHLARRHVHVLHLGGRHLVGLAVLATDQDVGPR